MNPTNSAAAATAQITLTPAELEQAHSCIRQAQQGLLGATKGLSDAQWKFKPSPDCWSIAEILEHVVTVQELILGPMRGQLPSAPPAPETHDRSRIDAIVINQFPNRLAKFKAPEAAHPAGVAPPQSLERFAKNNAGLADFLQSTPGLRDHAIESRPLKAISKGEYQVMDGYQWILAAAAHTERHTKQILEVRADANFPES
jgi:hypothetical protein